MLFNIELIHRANSELNFYRSYVTNNGFHLFQQFQESVRELFCSFMIDFIFRLFSSWYWHGAKQSVESHNAYIDNNNSDCKHRTKTIIIVIINDPFNDWYCYWYGMVCVWTGVFHAFSSLLLALLLLLVLVFPDYEISTPKKTFVLYFRAELCLFDFATRLLSCNVERK